MADDRRSPAPDDGDGLNRGPAVRGLDRTSARRVSRLALAALVVGAAAAFAAALLLARGMATDWLWAVAVAGGAAAAIGGWVLFETLSEHFRALERLRGLAIALRDPGVGATTAVPPAGDGETAALRDALVALAHVRRRERANTERRLAAVLANLRDAIVVVTERGQVSLVNGAAKMLLGEERSAIGTSIFDAVARETLSDAWTRARSGGPVTARLDLPDGRAVDATISDLGDDAGAMIVIADSACADAGGALDHDLSLHDRPPDAPQPDATTPLDRLPAAVIDTETTGLVPSQDRIVSLGGIRLHGARLYRAVTFDCLVNPGIHIPARASAIHGITDEMVAAAPPLAARLNGLLGLIAGAAVIGHNIGFDLAIIAAECRRARLDWQPPALALDSLQIAAALDPQEEALDLEAIASRHGLDTRGRHTALGDSLVTAALWQRLLPRLRERGVVTVGQAQAFAATATRVVARQRTAGW